MKLLIFIHQLLMSKYFIIYIFLYSPLTIPQNSKDKDCKNLIQLMLDKNKNSRYYKFEQISSHLWFKDFNWEALLSLDVKPEYIPQLPNNKENHNPKLYLDYIKTLKEWEQTDHKLKINEDDKTEFDEWFKKF